MNSALPKSRRRATAGYTLLMVVFLVASILIATATAVPSILTEGRREKEAEMVWRGEQYVRAIGLYYRKFGKYPTKVEDLTKATNGVRFLRQAYTDPMNKEDGSWRFIYVGPNGQLIGSLRPTTLLQTALSGSGVGSLMGAPQQPAPPSAAGNPASGAGGPAQQTNTAANPNPLSSQPQPLEGDVIGGNIIGVGSKVKKPSLKIYMGGDTYEQWEFIWNPLASGINPVQAPGTPGIQTGAPGVPLSGTGGIGTNPNSPNGQPQGPQTPVINLPSAPSPTQ